MRKSHDPLWHDIWTLLVRFLGKHLHSDIQLTNCMLKMMEHAFRNPQDRIASFDCWKTLIDTCYLDTPYISNSKHIKLLMTPLKVNLGKTEQIQLKKMEVWVHLIKNLKENTTTCLDAFLKFCFGSNVGNTMKFEGVESCMTTNISLLLKKTEALQELLGELPFFIKRSFRLLFCTLFAFEMKICIEYNCSYFISLNCITAFLQN